MNGMNNGWNGYNNQNNAFDQNQQNVNYQEQPVVNNTNDSSSKRNNNLVTIILLLLVIGLAGFIIYDKINNKEEVKESAKRDDKTIYKIDDSKAWAYMEKVAEYKIIGNENGQNTNVVYEYPVINIDSEAAKKYNKEVKNEVTNKNSKFINHNALNVGCSESSEDDLSAYIINNNQKKYIGYYDLDSYEIKETEEYIIVIFKEGFTPIVTFCDWVNEVSIFAISKKTGEEISNKSLVELQGYNYSEILKGLYKKYYLQNREYYDNSCSNGDSCLSNNPNELDYENFVKDRRIIMVKLVDKLEIFVHPIDAVEFVDHYYYDNNDFVLIDE